MPPRKSAKNPEPAIHPFDQIHGTETSGLVPAGRLLTGHPNDAHITAYYGVAPSILRTLVDLWRETDPPHPISRYTFVDIGAGKGRAMLVASQLPFHKVIGIELNPDMADIAQHNLDLWLESHAIDTTAPPIAPIRLLQQDALEYDLPRTPTLAFLFHPFEAPVLRALLRRIEAQYSKRPGTLDILYVNDEQKELFEQEHPRFNLLWNGRIYLSREDAASDRATIAHDADGLYATTGYEDCSIYRLR